MNEGRVLTKSTYKKPGDTSLFHIHSTPSLFLLLSNTDVGSQIMGKEWIKDRNEMGQTAYRSFINDTIVQRVCNLYS